MIMCDYCLEYYHPKCIGLNITEEYAETLSSFKCVFCTDKGIDSPLYIEGENLSISKHIFANFFPSKHETQMDTYMSMITMFVQCPVSWYHLLPG